MRMTAAASRRVEEPARGRVALNAAARERSRRGSAAPSIATPPTSSGGGGGVPRSRAQRRGSTLAADEPGLDQHRDEQDQAEEGRHRAGRQLGHRLHLHL